MSCPDQKKLQAYLDEQLSPADMDAVEGHIAQCADCQKQLDKLLDNPLKIANESLEIEDAVIVDKIKAHRKGIRRITLYGVLGFILGLFSRYYTADHFIVTKALMALPYKLAEFALGIFFGRNALPPWEQYQYGPPIGMGFFPYHPTLEIVVEFITPAIILTFIAIMIGHLVSDRRVFRRKDIVKFLLAGIMVFSLWVGAVHGVYSVTLNKIDHLAGIKAVNIYAKQQESTSWLMCIDQHNLSEPKYAQLVDGIAQAEKTKNVSRFNRDVGYQLWLEFDGGGRIIGHLEQDTGIFIMPNNNQYQFSSETMALFQQVIGRDHSEEENR